MNSEFRFDRVNFYRKCPCVKCQTEASKIKDEILKRRKELSDFIKKEQNKQLPCKVYERPDGTSNYTPLEASIIDT